MLVGTTAFLAAIPASARRLIPHTLAHNCLHARQRILNLGAAGNLPGRKLVPAQAASQICPELQLPQPHLERLPAVRAGQINPYASMIFEHAAPSVKVRPRG